MKKEEKSSVSRESQSERTRRERQAMALRTNLRRRKASVKQNKDNQS